MAYMAFPATAAVPPDLSYPSTTVKCFGQKGKRFELPAGVQLPDPGVVQPKGAIDDLLELLQAAGDKQPSATADEAADPHSKLAQLRTITIGTAAAGDGAAGAGAFWPGFQQLADSDGPGVVVGVFVSSSLSPAEPCYVAIATLVTKVGCCGFIAQRLACTLWHGIYKRTAIPMPRMEVTWQPSELSACSPAASAGRLAAMGYPGRAPTHLKARRLAQICPAT